MKYSNWLGWLFALLILVLSNEAYADSGESCLKASSENIQYSVCGVDEVMFPSQNRLVISGLKNGQVPLILTKYTPSIGQTEPATSWQANGSWENGSYKLNLTTPGVYFIHLRILNSDGTESSNIFMGQVRVIDPSLITQLIDNVYFRRFNTTRYDAAPVGWVSYSEERKKIHNLDDLTKKIIANYPKVNKYYDLNFSDIPQKDRIAIYSMNVIANYWRLGSCILTKDTPPKNQEDYFKYSSACCSDFTLVLYGVLKKQGFNPEVITMPGHNLMQVKLSDGKSYMLDATGNYFIDGNIGDVMQKQKKLDLHLINFSMMEEGKTVSVSDERREFMNTVFMQYASYGYDDFGYVPEVANSWLDTHAKLLGVD